MHWLSCEFLAFGGKYFLKILRKILSKSHSNKLDNKCLYERSAHEPLVSSFLRYISKGLRALIWRLSSSNASAEFLAWNITSKKDWRISGVFIENEVKQKLPASKFCVLKLHFTEVSFCLNLFLSKSIDSYYSHSIQLDHIISSSCHVLFFIPSL